jgi:hypothetical protein
MRDFCNGARAADIHRLPFLGERLLPFSVACPCSRGQIIPPHSGPMNERSVTRVSATIIQAAFFQSWGVHKVLIAFPSLAGAVMSTSTPKHDSNPAFGDTNFPSRARICDPSSLPAFKPPDSGDAGATFVVSSHRGTQSRPDVQHGELEMQRWSKGRAAVVGRGNGGRDEVGRDGTRTSLSQRYGPDFGCLSIGTSPTLLPLRPTEEQAD